MFNIRDEVFPIKFKLSLVLLLLLTQKVTTRAMVSREGKAVWQGNVIYYNLSISLNFSEAVDYCGQFGGHLPSVHSREDIDELYQAIPGELSDLWLGAEPRYKGSSFSSFKDHKWMDGSPSNYEEEYLHCPHHCCGVALIRGRMVNGPCGFKLVPVCVLPRFTPSRVRILTNQAASNLAMNILERKAVHDPEDDLNDEEGHPNGSLDTQTDQNVNTKNSGDETSSIDSTDIKELDLDIQELSLPTMNETGDQNMTTFHDSDLAEWLRMNSFIQKLMVLVKAELKSSSDQESTYLASLLDQMNQTRTLLKELNETKQDDTFALSEQLSNLERGNILLQKQIDQLKNDTKSTSEMDFLVQNFNRTNTQNQLNSLSLAERLDEMKELFVQKVNETKDQNELKINEKMMNLQSLNESLQLRLNELERELNNLTFQLSPSPQMLTEDTKEASQQLRTASLLIQCTIFLIITILILICLLVSVIYREKLI